jgi:hypothetical protein
MKKYIVSSTLVEEIIKNDPVLKKKEQEFNSSEVLNINSGFIFDYLKYAEPLTDAPKLFHFVCSLLILSTVLNKKVFLPYGDQVLYPNIYAVILAPSSLFRKSTSINIARRLLEDVQEDLILPNDVTYEKMVANLSKQSVGLICWNEIGGALEVMSKDYNIGLKALITELFDYTRIWKRELQSKIYIIESPCLSILGASTVEWFMDKIKEKDVRGGFLPRFIIIPAVKKEKTLALPGKRDEALRQSLIETLKQKNQKSGEMYLEKAEKEMYEDWYRKHEKELEESDKKEILSGFYSRLAIYVLKLAMIFQLSYSDTLKIESEALIRACKLVDYLKLIFGKFLKEEFAVSFKMRQKNKVLQKVKHHQGIGYSELLRLSHMLAVELKPILDTLIQEEELKETTDRKYYALRT